MRMANKFGGNTIKLAVKAIIIIAMTVLLFNLFNNYSSIFENHDIDYYAIVITNPNGVGDSTNVHEGKKIQALPTEIFAKDNFHDYQSCFFLPVDTTIEVNVVGEAADYSTNPFLFNSWDNDGVEMYFDMKNDKTPFFDLNGADRQFRILWKTKQIDGKNIVKTGVKIEERDPSPTTYIMEITYPWKSLGYIIPNAMATFGFDAAIMDSDWGAEKAKLNWHSKNDEDWRSTSNYGTLKLINNSKISVDTNYAFAVKRNKKLSGKKSASLFSSQTPFYTIKNITVGYIKDTLDLSGKFRAEWDDKNLYIQICVTDDIKTLANALFDYGWIEDYEGKVIWKMTIDKLKYAGGALKNRRVDTTLTLKRGYYFLKYHTDESHSPSQWDDAPPATSFYGIKVSYWAKDQAKLLQITKPAI